MLEKLVNSKWGKRLLNLAGGLFIGGFALFNPITASAEEAVLTVLCHGIKSQPESMKKIEDAIKDQSAVVNVYYPSTEQRIKNFAYNLDLSIKDKLVKLKEQDIDVNSIVLVGHSTGGLVERYYIECGNASFEDVVSKVKAIVMIGTPNHGSPLADIVCYHAALAGERSDAIPLSIIEQTKGPKSDLLKMPSLTEPLHAKGIKGFLDVLTKPTTLINFVDSSWGRRAVYDLNTAPDGFIESELNKFGLKPGVYYCVIRGNDNNFATAILVKGPSDGVVPAGSADLSDKVSNKENYRLETVKANHLNITENDDAIRIVKEIIENTNKGRIEKEFINSIGMKFVLIKAGTFMMGEENSSSQHRVTLTKDFYMQTTEVTQAQYEMICDNFHLKNKDRPAVWPQNYVIEFCEKISEREKKHYRLPTEAEWEYACRAGSTKKFYFGDDESKLKEYAWYKGSIDFQPFDFQPGGKKKPNAWGLYDMLGNAWEWCSDIYGEYPKESVVDPIGPKSGDNEILVRVIKGGGVWYNSPPTCYLRESGEPYISAGFRCVLEKNSLNSQKTTPSRSERKDIVSPKDACVYNLRQIEGAVERFGMEKRIRSGNIVTITQLIESGYLKSALSCPSCGPYDSIQTIGVDPVCPGWKRGNACGRYHVLP